MKTGTQKTGTLVFTMAVSEAILLTAKEMIESGMDKEWAAQELADMYSGYGLSDEWFKTVLEGAETIVAAKM